MKRYKAAVFDLDGTLLDTIDDLAAAVNHTLAAHGLTTHSREAVMSFVGNGYETLMRLALPHDISDSDRSALTEESRRYYAAHSRERTAPYQGIYDELSRLREAGVLLAIVSNKPHEAVVSLCADLFPDIYALGESPSLPKKPEPHMVLRALDELGATPSEAIYIGDSEVDIMTAENVGCDILAVAWGFRGRERLRALGVENIIDNVAELASAII